jgi:hypothetical protein
VFDFIVYLLILLSFVYLIFENLKIKYKYRQSVTTLFQVYIDKTIAEQAAIKAIEDQDIAADLGKESQEGFINFLNQSRDWAFKYIEDTQGVVSKFVSEVEKDIDYFDIYGDQLSAEPNYNSMARISKAFKELKTVLPSPTLSSESDTLE